MARYLPLLLGGVVLAAGVPLVTGHAAHLLAALSFLLLAACPLMHMVMHRGYGGYHEAGDRRGRS
ncbi:MAG: DUF2933 domain-containing protein [Rhodospirillales bacterium]|nr:DUF2933 domain-containing protein [Rhodospirillales bacterium]